MSELEFYDGSYSGAEIDAAVAKVRTPDTAPDATHTDALISSAAVAEGISAVSTPMKVQTAIYNTAVAMTSGTAMTVMLKSGRKWTDYNYVVLLLATGAENGSRASATIPRSFISFNTWWPLTTVSGNALVQGAVRVGRIQIPDTSPAQYYDDRLSITVNMESPFLRLINGAM